MRILVTRPQASAQELGARLEALGHTVLIDPLLRVALLDFALTDVAGLQATVVTSRHALHSLARQPDVLTRLSSKPLFAVGPATAALGRAMGFEKLHEGPGDAAGLAAAIRSALPGTGRPILYLRGEVTAFDLAQDLNRHGLTVQTAVAYRTAPAITLLPATLDALARSSIDAVVLLSARTARTYADLILQHKKLKNIENIAHFCLAETIAQALAPLALSGIRVARRPRIEELLALVGGAAKCLP